jgi:hypothetical protein
MLHSRGCRTGKEILTLLKTGYADGANARWRALHEISIVIAFIAKYGNDTAERYLRHEVIESHKAALEYQEYYKKLGYEPLSEEKLEKIKREYDSLIVKYGKSYKEQYGWAADDLKLRNPKISQIEKDVKLDHFRPYYRMASHSIHLNPKGIIFPLGLMDLTKPILLAGPSNAGLADPGQCMVISLNQITADLLSLKPSVTTIVYQKVMNQFVTEICKNFAQAHEILQKEENEKFQYRNVDVTNS